MANDRDVFMRRFWLLGYEDGYNGETTPSHNIPKWMMAIYRDAKEVGWADAFGKLPKDVSKCPYPGVD